jgi:hypothetical protein
MADMNPPILGAAAGAFAQQIAAPALPPAIPAPLEGVNFMLDIIGFHDPAERLRLMEASLADYEDFRYLVEKDIRDMAEEFAKRTVANGRMTFGLGRTKKLCGLMHWIQDCFRCADDPDHTVFDEQTLNEAQSRALIRKSDLDLVDTNSKAADPGKFKDERKWPEWSKSFGNFLSVIPGVSGIPLNYVIREDEEPDEDAEYVNFNERMVARAPHTGQYYLADSRRVHNLLTGFLHGELTENWIRTIARFQDGRRDMTALRNHYAGEGNSTRRIADAKRIQATLHYKNERALPFSKFLDSLQKMFNIFYEEKEPFTERAKVDELLSKVQNPALTAAIAQLRFQLNTEGIDFTVAANHLNAAVSQTPDYQISRQIKSTNTNNREGGSGRFGGRGGGRFNNSGRGGRGSGRGRNNNRYSTSNKSKPSSSGYYSPAEWNKLSFEERDKIRKERDKKGEQGGTKRTIGDISVDHVTAIIGAMQQTPAASTDDTEEAAQTPTTSNTQAGNAFGGKASVKKSRS